MREINSENMEYNDQVFNQAVMVIMTWFCVYIAVYLVGFSDWYIEFLVYSILFSLVHFNTVYSKLCIAIYKPKKTKLLTGCMGYGAFMVLNDFIYKFQFVPEKKVTVFIYIVFYLVLLALFDFYIRKHQKQLR
ncbi:hypothetical protein A9267_12750 [Shewanella sp. UCD-FRSSP16_17]|uniref:hypothetical protein n=1 Tax=Shewanella sp. UCD-FRSSP16_17 TaxID=1853256 RepID=UPI0007EEA501|nr:hypothetical protein [Shewanella sp. UCD-FRSSP16_17]OBT06769.1 hypothetical protein A9267_12750 [Shewanella sp. UCD-FRSSP16_17]